ncbi:MAG: hypothetical protein N2203_04230 [Bacteroidia bacterium]|nr:hypothetical protein [Bacteroidia bacterium]
MDIISHPLRLIVPIFTTRILHQLMQINTNDIISTLYYSREAIEYLFAKKDNISISQLKSEISISEEMYNRMKSLEIIYEYENTVVLNDSVINMLEDILQIGESTPGIISEYVSEIKRYISFYQETHHYRFISPLKKYLRRIDKTITREIIKLQKSIDDTYKNESNYRIKLRRLEEYREKRDTIINNIYILQNLLSENHNTLSSSADAQLFQIIQTLKQTLLENLDYLIEIQTDITDYINKIQYQLDIYQKAQQLKELKDQGLLNFSTNFHEIIEKLNPIRFNGHKAPRTKISVDTLYTDIGQQLCQKIAEKYKVSQLRYRTSAGQLNFNINEKILDHQILIDTQKLVEKFLQQKEKNLFEFILNFKFPKQIGDLTINQKLSLFVEILVQYEKQLNFSYQLKFIEITENEKTQKIGYTVILPSKERKKITTNS